ncbi:MAG: presqualene diphosphate synthase HpnD [Chloroflexi bacterium]|nr:presqualene diphosphate synthase HpnD [Chloroflexota bacterium]
MSQQAFAVDLKAAYNECQVITRREARNFYYAFVTLPKQRRRAIYAAYAFGRIADDIADGDGLIETKTQSLAGLRDSLHTALTGNPSGPVMTALADVATTYDIPEHLFAQIIDGVEMDLTKSRYANFGELREYCYRVASVVGLVSTQIFGYRDEKAKEYAVDLGLAMQLTNIMRDVKEDAERDRVYIPQDEMARFDVTEAQLQAGIIEDNFLALMRFQSERARSYFDSGARLFPLLNPRSRSCAVGLHHLYSSLLDRIEKRGYDVFGERVSLPTWQKLKLTVLLWTTSFIPRGRRR